MKNNNANVNVTINNASVNNVNNKEDKDMMNNTMNNEAKVVFALTQEMVEAKTKDELRDMLVLVNVEMSKTTFKNTKKAELVAKVMEYCDPSLLEIAEVVDTLKEDAVETQKEEKDMNENYMEEKWNKLYAYIVNEYKDQTKNGLLRKNQARKSAYSLFYKNTKSAASFEYITTISHLYGATSTAIRKIYPQSNANFARLYEDGKVKTEYIEKSIELAIARGLIVSESIDRDDVTVYAANLDKKTQDMFNDACRSRIIKYERTNNGGVKLIANNESGKELLTRMYGKVTVYGITAAQYDAFLK